jgi:hypothetical protein
LKFHFFAEYAAKDLGRLTISELAASDLNLCADELLRPLEGERCERPNVVDGDRLIRFIAVNRINELAL